MRNALYQARQLAFWMGVVLLFRILLHIPDAEGMLPVNQLELFSSGMDIFMYGLMIIYSVFLWAQIPNPTPKIKQSLVMVIIAASILIILHLLTWRFAGCDPDVFWWNGPVWFKIIYLISYFLMSALFLMIYFRLPRGVHARNWAMVTCLINLPFILLLVIISQYVPALSESFVFMLFKDLSMDIALFGFYWALSNAPKQLDKIACI